MYYFGYCTYLLEAELRKYLPEAVAVTKAKAVNRQIQFRAAGERTDRGWCHLADTGTYGKAAQGIVFEVDDAHLKDDFDDFDIVFLTVQGDDGKHYDCFTYVLSQPGIRMRPPRFYWERVPQGLAEQEFPADYRAEVQQTFDEAAECPDFDRPVPAGKPGRSADSR
ncbi:gamma-glutamylcyclotransferase [Nonomuraea zeae]|uniref:Gamma-glutamylcyclotransferase n=1 Tax=Nonomuraea zeae TaxID=1642303 RepID=A0A5S4HBW0_9ACTN|nr:gamma-glutamylcyclotransferase [Nonomuraea zeae]TMR36370.1 gamma-glutamylcyclotransferase [Nonomuraea zeae]